MARRSCGSCGGTLETAAFQLGGDGITGDFVGEKYGAPCLVSCDVYLRGLLGGDIPRIGAEPASPPAEMGETRENSGASPRDVLQAPRRRLRRR